MEPTSTPPAPITQKPISLNLVLFIICIISLLLTIFFIYQNWLLNQKLRSLATPDGDPSEASAKEGVPDLTTNWETYTNITYGYTISCPEDSTHKVEIDDPANGSIPKYQEICYEGNNQVRINISRKEFLANLPTEPAGIYSEIKNIPDRPDLLLRIHGFDKVYFDQILSTFKFNAVSPSPTPIIVTDPKCGMVYLGICKTACTAGETKVSALDNAGCSTNTYCCTSKNGN